MESRLLGTPPPRPGLEFPRRYGRAVRTELTKTWYRPTLWVYLLLVVLATAGRGALEYSTEKEREARDAPAAPAAETHPRGFAIPGLTPAPKPEPTPEAETAVAKGANGFLAFSGGLWAGLVLAALLLLLHGATLLSGEATGGTWRLLLVRPVTRSDILLGKATVLLLLVLGFVIAVAATSLILGFALGGYGDIVDVRWEQVDYEAGEVAAVVLAAVALAPFALFATACFGLFVSALFENSANAVIAAALGGLFLVAVGFILPPDEAGWSFIGYVGRYADVAESWSRGLSEYRFDRQLVLPGILVPLGSAAVLLAATWFLVARKEIHS